MFVFKNIDIENEKGFIFIPTVLQNVIKFIQMKLEIIVSSIKLYIESKN